MAAIVNERDLILQATLPRVLPQNIPMDQVDGLPEAIDSVRSIRIYSNEDTFIGTGGSVTPASITLSVEMNGISGTTVWSVVAGTATLIPSGNTCTVSGTSVSGNSVTIMAEVSSGGMTYSDKITLNKLGAISTQDAVDLSSQVVGQLDSADITGLGALALLNTVDLNTQTTGALNGLTQVTNLGTLAYANSIAANQIGAGTLAAGVIYAGSINANNITSGTLTGRTVRTSAGNTRVEMASSTNTLDVYISGTKYISIGGDTGNGYISINKGSSFTPGIYVTSTSGAPGIFSSMSSTGVAAIEGYSSTSSTGIFSTNSSTGVAMAARGTSTTSSTNHAFRGQSDRGSGSSGLVGTAIGYAFYDEGGGYGPFTGAHDGMVPNSFEGEPGDILIDDQVVRTRGVSDVIMTAKLCSSVEELGAIGILESSPGSVSSVKQAALITGMDPETGHPYMSGEWVLYGDTHKAVKINAVGEGLINVCGRNGNLQKGDLIVCSDMPGKGQRQNDGIIRNTTVARSRVDVIFDYPDEVKLVPCIYLCG